MSELGGHKTKCVKIRCYEKNCIDHHNKCVIICSATNSVNWFTYML